jgi:pyruvate ferredoxin oxidoreductase beta subunit
MNNKLTKHLASGHAMCAGCGIPAIVRTVLGATNDPVIVSNATGCLEVTTTIYPNTSWRVPYIHSVFGNAAATAAGIDAAQKAFEKSGKLKKKAKIIAFGGDGGTYDIGLQALSGALERGHDFLYVCYDNEGYMNTGGQRSGGTPYGANTETAPAGEFSFGKTQQRKDLMEIVKAHGIKYLAQANVAYLDDLEMKAKKALNTPGPSFLLVLQPCTNMWKFPTSQYVNIGKLATETNFWPLYEISAQGGSASGGEEQKYIINYIPTNPKPIEEFLKTQGRFKHLFTSRNKKIIVQIQEQVNENWEKLKKKCI